MNLKEENEKLRELLRRVYNYVPIPDQTRIDSALSQQDGNEVASPAQKVNNVDTPKRHPVAVPESWWQLIHDTIRNYRLTTSVDADGDGYELIDAMTADGQPVSEGIEECTYLTDAIWNALIAQGSK